MNPNPTCKLECRFSHGMSMTTCAYYPPVYDKHGNNTNPDMNVTSTTIECGICDKRWSASTQNNKTTYQELL